MAKLKIRRSKTDHAAMKGGGEVLTVRSGSHICLVAMLEKYMAKAGTCISLISWLCLFREITRTARGEMFRASGSISYARLRELFKMKLQELGYNPANYGLHSLRAGGATAAANSWVPDRLFKGMGAGSRKMPKTAILKIQYIADCLPPKNWGFKLVWCVVGVGTVSLGMEMQNTSLSL